MTLNQILSVPLVNGRSSSWAWLAKSVSYLVVCVSLVPFSSSSASAYHPPLYGLESGKVPDCPIAQAKTNFDLSQFLGDWYVLAYEYPKKMRLKDLSCVGLHFSMAGFGDIQSNFTFRFPAKTGFFYHVPTFSIVSQVKTSLWETQFVGVELISSIVETDYQNWAVLVQCRESGGGSDPKFLSTRILSRARTLSTEHFMEVQAAIEKVGASADFRYPVVQDECEELDSA
ncbi:hypothetical protein TCAL_06325 [Tigriopus californicus]|uniref:Lipocalin/cytosolic fatty-acid binding domain-containing protein n=1 Tax=Tigriopus californicus TaxID=6832 RepID=A0A553PFU6_TIGCA|nr:hypothetical protein TCAL_06325 [Tigriopus californicus]|eukprot:TCALIF_06325-PA protein Name:"Protein of unknown function" AED:0.00 eAED:0.00 QI:128/1/1/1/1/1/3/200/228